MEPVKKSGENSTLGSDIPPYGRKCGCLAAAAVLDEGEVPVRLVAASQPSTVMSILGHSVIFPRGVVHRVENRWGLTKVAVVLLNGLLW